MPPQDTLYCFFKPDAESLELLVLYGNPHAMETDRAVLFDTRVSGADLLPH